MRIALVQDFLRQGGTETQAVALANAFAAAGHTVLLLTFRPGGALATWIGERVHHVALQQRDRGLDWFAPGLLEVLRTFRPDVVQVMGRMANAHGWRIARAFPAVPLVATFRTGRPIPWFYRYTLRRAQAVVTNSTFAADQIVGKHHVERARVQVIRNALVQPTTPVASDTRDAIRRAIGTAPDAVVLLCTAMMRPGKGHRTLIDMAVSLQIARPWELWLAGDGVERGPCEQLAHAHGLAARIRFLGHRTDTQRLYAAADLAVLASRTESLPNFLVEAQSSGLPVIAWDTAGVRETFVPDESGLLVQADDPRAFAEAVRALADDAPRRARMSEIARTHAAAEFDPARQNQRYFDLYSTLTTA